MKDPIEIFEQRKVHREELISSGWEIVGGDSDAQSYDEIYQNFKTHRGFSLQNDELISIPNPSLIYSFDHISSLHEENRAEIDLILRRIVFEFFKENYGTTKCVVIDLNHDNYRFVPNEIVLNQMYEPWPMTFRPRDYVCYGTPDFKEGLFLDPRKIRLVVFGSQFVATMLRQFPMVPSEVRLDG